MYIASKHTSINSHFHIYRSIMTPVTASKTDGVPFVYKITNGVLCYYGSTGKSLDQRKSQHSATSNDCTSRVITQGELPWTMEVIEYVACTTKDELEDREAYYILNHPCVNVKLPGAERRAGGKAAYKRQYRQDNRDDLNAKEKQRYQDNKDEIKAKKNVKHDCVICGGRFSVRNKSRHFKSKKHQKAIAEAVALHSPPQPLTITNNFTINCTESTINQ